MRLLDHIFDDMIVEEFKLNIILPEGAEVSWTMHAHFITNRDIIFYSLQVGKLNEPYPVSRGKDSLHFTYLDTKGRPVITVDNVGDLTEKHIQDFQLDFKFPKYDFIGHLSFDCVNDFFRFPRRTAMMHEPLLLVIAYFLFFFLTIIYVRLDFSITKDEGSEARMKVAGVSEKVAAHQVKS